jgi:hypothetical protein
MLLLLLAAQAAPIESTPYWACLKREVALDLASKERPRDIADAAVSACRTDEPPLGPKLMQAVRVKVKDRLVQMVVEARAD